MNSINSAEDVLKYQLSTQILKSAVGEVQDSEAFSEVIESVMNALSGDNSNDQIASALGITNQDLSGSQMKLKIM